MDKPTLLELKLTACAYAKHGVAKHLQTTGRLPAVIGGPWSIIPMSFVLKERGADPVLTDDEWLIFEAIVREGRLPGGCVRLVQD